MPFFESQTNAEKLTDGGTGTNIKSLNQGMLASLLIPFPVRSQQKIFVAKLEELTTETQRLESLYQQKLNTLAELKKSLLHEAFSGRL